MIHNWEFAFKKANIKNKNLFDGTSEPSQQMQGNNRVLAKGQYSAPTYKLTDYATPVFKPIFGVMLPEVIVTGNAPYKKLDYSNIAENEYLKNKYEEEVKNNIKASKELITLTQRKLADNGYYDLNTDDLSENEIRNIQKKIGAKVDGIFGKESIKKWREYNVDGKWGKRTEEAYNKSSNQYNNWDNEVPTKGVEWCAEWVSKKVQDATASSNYGVWGDAWKMPDNIIKAGGTEVYNIYTQDEFKNLKDVNDLKAKTKAALNKDPFNVKNLQIGDIVGIYIPSSNMHEKAWKEGSTFNTHVGVVTGFDKDNMPIIEHNIHQSHRKDRADNISGSLFGKAKIATVSRPNYKSLHTPFNTESVQSQYTQEEDSPLFKRYANSVAGSKDLLKKLFPSVNTDEVELITLAVQGRETGFMKNKKSDQTGIAGIKTTLGNFYRDNIKEKPAEQVSSNLSKMKLSSFTYNERHLLGLKNASDLENPEKAGRAAAYLMAKNYDYFKRLQATYPNLGITDSDVRYLTELSYNQGMRKLSTIGFTEQGLPAPKEIETIRTMAAPDAKIKDISSTNYRYLGKIGEFLYNNFEDGHSPYISAAENYRSKLLTIKDQKR